jgi:hypothetical protein
MVKAPGLRPECAGRNRPLVRDEQVRPRRHSLNAVLGHRGLPHGCGQTALSRSIASVATAVPDVLSDHQRFTIGGNGWKENHDIGSKESEQIKPGRERSRAGIARTSRVVVGEVRTLRIADPYV